jgi:SAM-dependent methyltransferase
MSLNAMRISKSEIGRVANERVILDELLPLEGARVLELGCGNAANTRVVAQKTASVLALEVDEIQLAKNRTIENLPNVSFGSGGAAKIPAPDSHFDIVLMFKSLHHVQADLLDDAFSEIRRVLRPGGLAYISEPIFAGDFNEILRLFHDEETMRATAYAAEERAVLSRCLALVKQTFFLQPRHFDSFSQFEHQLINATHTDHKLSPALFEEVRQQFNKHMTHDGANFQMPMRVDLFKKDKC